MAAEFGLSHYVYEEILLLVNLPTRISSYTPLAYAPQEVCDMLFDIPPETEGSGIVS
jgi:hypothetical protein